MNSTPPRTTNLLAGRFSFKRLVITVIAIYLVLMVLAWLFADAIIHHPPAHRFGPLPGEVTLTTFDGVKISAVWLPNPKATHTILFGHGNAEDLGYDLPYLRELGDAGFNVLGYDYRGYGHSEGCPSEKGLCRDIEAAYAYLSGPLGIPPDRIILLGRSLGSGPSTYLAATKPVGGLILESAFTSAFRVAIPFPFFPFDQFPNRKRLAQVRCPLLVIHGTRDTIISIHHGRKLYETYGGPKRCLWVEGADHNDLFPTDPEKYRQTIQEFGNSLPLAKNL